MSNFKFQVRPTYESPEEALKDLRSQREFPWMDTPQALGIASDIVKAGRGRIAPTNERGGLLGNVARGLGSGIEKISAMGSDLIKPEDTDELTLKNVAKNAIAPGVNLAQMLAEPIDVGARSVADMGKGLLGTAINQSQLRDRNPFSQEASQLQEGLKPDIKRPLDPIFNVGALVNPAARTSLLRRIGNDSFLKRRAGDMVNYAIQPEAELFKAPVRALTKPTRWVANKLKDTATWPSNKKIEIGGEEFDPSAITKSSEGAADARSIGELAATEGVGVGVGSTGNVVRTFYQSIAGDPSGRTGRTATNIVRGGSKAREGIVRHGLNMVDRAKNQIDIAFEKAVDDAFGQLPKGRNTRIKIGSLKENLFDAMNDSDIPVKRETPEPSIEGTGATQAQLSTLPSIYRDRFRGPDQFTPQRGERFSQGEVSPLARGEETVIDILEEIFSATETQFTTPAQLWKLRKRVDNMASKVEDGSYDQTVLIRVRNVLQDHLLQEVPDFGKAMDLWADGTSFLSSVKQNLELRPGNIQKRNDGRRVLNTENVNIDDTMDALVAALEDGDSQAFQVLNKLTERTNSDLFKTAISASAMQKPLGSGLNVRGEITQNPRRAARTAQNIMSIATPTSVGGATGIILAASGAPLAMAAVGSVATALPVAVLYSPRLMGIILSDMAQGNRGKMKRAFNNARQAIEGAAAMGVPIKPLIEKGWTVGAILERIANMEMRTDSSSAANNDPRKKKLLGAIGRTRSPETAKATR